MKLFSVKTAFIFVLTFAALDSHANGLTPTCSKAKSKAEILSIAETHANKQGSKVTIESTEAFFRKNKWHITLYLKPSAPGNHVFLEVSSCGEIIDYWEGK